MLIFLSKEAPNFPRFNNSLLKLSRAPRQHEAVPLSSRQQISEEIVGTRFKGAFIPSDASNVKPVLTASSADQNTQGMTEIAAKIIGSISMGWQHEVELEEGFSSSLRALLASLGAPDCPGTKHKLCLNAVEEKSSQGICPAAQPAGTWSRYRGRRGNCQAVHTGHGFLRQLCTWFASHVLDVTPGLWSVSGLYSTEASTSVSLLQSMI